MNLVLDPSLPAPPPCPEPTRLEGPSDALAHAGPATRRPFVLSAPRGRVVGDEMAGIERAEADGHALLADLGAGTGPASSVVLGPRQARRELVADARSLVETAVLPERTPGLVVQWVPGPGSEEPLHIRFRLPAGADRHREAEGTLVVGCAGPGLLLYRLFPAPSRWSVSADGRVEATVAAGEDAPVTLLATRGDGAEQAFPALSAAARTGVHETRADRAVAASRRERLALHTGVPELDVSLEWAKARLDAAAGAGAGADGPLAPLREALLCLGRAASGDHERSDRAAAALSREGAPSLLALGWTAGWTGSPAGWSPGEIRAAAEALLVPAREGPPLERLLARAAMSAAADVLAGLTGRDDAGALEASIPRGPLAPPGRVRLPMLASLLGPVLGVPVGPTPGPDSFDAPDSSDGPDGLRRALGAWALFATGRPEEGYLRLRDHMGEAFRGPRGCWSGAPGTETELDDPVAAALVPAALLHGLLGAGPDAAFGRLRLAPALPSSWSSFRATGIRLGDAVLELAYRAEGARRTFVLRPTAGSVPPNVVFEPLVPGAVASVEVDGRPTEVEPQRTGDRVRVGLQIPLDRERSVSLVGTDG